MSATIIPIVAMNHGHRQQILMHLISLSPESRRLRFGMPLSQESITSYVDKIDYKKDGLFGIFNDSMILIAFTHAARTGKMVEFGVSVLPEYRKRGYGTALFEKCELFARNHNINKMYMHCLRENDKMMKMARRAKMKVIFDASEVDSYLELPPADAGSLTKDLLQSKYANFDLALKKNVHGFEVASTSMKKLMNAYANKLSYRNKENNDTAETDHIKTDSK